VIEVRVDVLVPHPCAHALGQSGHGHALDGLDGSSDQAQLGGIVDACHYQAFLHRRQVDQDLRVRLGGFLVQRRMPVSHLGQQGP